MPSKISDLSQKIIESNAFRDRFRNLQRVVAKKRILRSKEDIEEIVTTKLILQASVLALSDDFFHRHVAQKISALFFELSENEEIINLAVQVISSRLGNFPVISVFSNIFQKYNIINKLREENIKKDFIFDAEIAGALFIEEEQSRLNIKNKTYYFNTLQKEILNALSNNSLVSFSAPTSFGKSFIVRHHIARLYADNLLSRALIIVPTKSLIDDFFEDILTLKQELALDFVVFTHSRSIQEAPKKCVFILTQERLSFLIKNNPDFVKTFELVYCDEAHYISRGYRGFVLRNAIYDVVSLCGIFKQGGNSKYIFSSPVIKNPDYYKNKIFTTMDEKLSFHKEIKFSPVEKNIHFIEVDGRSFCHYLYHESLNEEKFSDKLEKLSTKEFPDDVVTANSSESHIEKNIYAALASNLSGGSIFFTTSPLAAHKYALVLSRFLKDRGQFLEVKEIDDLAKYIKDHYDDCFGLIDLLKKGIGLHYGPMPVGLRRAVVSLFERGIINYLICTSTLLEGVNLPAKNIFLFSDKFGGQTGKEKHTVLSFWNLLGRAGRITYGLSGNVFCVEQKIDKYKDLIEKTEAEIIDPEIEVIKQKKRKKYIIQTLIDLGKRFDYVSSKSRNDIEFLIFELFMSNKPENTLERLAFKEYDREKLGAILKQQKDSLTIPLTLLQENPGIDPRMQDNLFNNLDSMLLEDLELFMTPISNLLAINGNHLLTLLNIISARLKWPSTNQAEIERIARRLTQWIHELSVSGFIQQSLRHMESGSDFSILFKRLTRAINTIRDLETEFSFNAPKYLKCFFDILMFVCQKKGLKTIDDHLERINAFLFALESGVCTALAMFLIEQGISRSVAIRVSFILKDTSIQLPISKNSFLPAPIQNRIKESLSSIAFKELNEHIYQ